MGNLSIFFGFRLDGWKKKKNNNNGKWEFK